MQSQSHCHLPYIWLGKAILVIFAIKYCTRDVFRVNLFSRIVSSLMYYTAMKRPFPKYGDTPTFLSKILSLQLTSYAHLYHVQATLCVFPSQKILSSSWSLALPLSGGVAGSLTSNMHNIVTIIHSLMHNPIQTTVDLIVENLHLRHRYKMINAEASALAAK